MRLNGLLRVGAIALLACGCREGAAPSAGSNSNWLKSCDTDASCGAQTSCHCGACTRTCATDTDCAELEDAQCVHEGGPELRSLCATDVGAGLCLPRCEPGSCGPGRVCMLGACVIVTPPGGELCSALDAPTDDERVREDEVMSHFQSLRIEGGVACGSGTPSGSGSALRFDARLTCAARALAADANVTRDFGLVDSQGRSTADRLRAAGYAFQFWGEGIAAGARNAERALSLMLSDESACVGLTAPATVDVGVAHVGDIDVVTVAEP